MTVPNQTPVDASTTERREFLRILGGAATLGAAGVALSERAEAASQAQAQFDSDPFELGVASGDPLPDSVVLWTRLAPKPLEPQGGMSDDPIPVLYEVATDDSMEDIVKRDVIFASPDWAHSVHADVSGLEEDTEYYYRFQAGDKYSPIGHTQTAPAEDSSPGSLSFAFASCQSWPTGYYTAYESMAEDDLDLVIHLGDYIYEYPIPPIAGERSTDLPRRFNTEINTLEQYRLRHPYTRVIMISRPPTLRSRGSSHGMITKSRTTMPMRSRKMMSHRKISSNDEQTLTKRISSICRCNHHECPRGQTSHCTVDSPSVISRSSMCLILVSIAPIRHRPVKTLRNLIGQFLETFSRTG